MLIGTCLCSSNSAITSDLERPVKVIQQCDISWMTAIACLTPSL